MAQKTKDGCWIDSKGRTVPTCFINELLKKRDRTVERIVKIADKLQARMLKDKTEMDRLAKEYLAAAAKKYKEDWKGNAKLSNFNHTLQVIISVEEHFEFDEKLQIAKQKIDRCLTRWSEGAHKNLRAIVMHAFQVDKKGQLNQKAIIELKNYEIKDPEWQEAMKLISESTQVTGTKEYLNVYRRVDSKGDLSSKGKLTSIQLNFSAL